MKWERLRFGPTSALRLRTKLLLLALTTLALPWAGCQYAREMESVLREGERQGLLAVARTVAASMQGREELLFRDRSTPTGRELTARDIEPLVFNSVPVLDGNPEEWPAQSGHTKTFAAPNGVKMQLTAGTHERWLYLLIDVQGSPLVFDQSDLNPLDPASLGDRIWLGFDDRRGGQQRIFLSAQGPGELRGRRIEVREYGREEAVPEPRVTGAWRGTTNGLVLEARVPLSMIGRRFGVLVDDRAKLGGPRMSLGTLDPADLDATGVLVAASPDLAEHLQQFSQPGVELAIATTNGTTLARLAAPALPQDFTAMRGVLPRLYRRFLDGDAVPRRTSDQERARVAAEQIANAAAGKATTALLAGRYANRVIVAAAAPIYSADRRRVVGVLQLAQTADRWLTLRDRALTRLLNLTLLATGLAMAATFWFAGRLALRIARLRSASESALSREGLLSVELPETRAHDELGDLSRSFESLLRRLNDYTGYLRGLAGKLQHEIRTPLTIVRSSLENLESELLSPEAKTYVARAREGSERLNSMLVAMGAATRVEESIANSERTRFDASALLNSAVEAYGTAFPARRFSFEQPQSALFVIGNPDLVVQMLDKLIENAVDFTADGDTIRTSVSADEGFVRIDVVNPGPPLPEGDSSRLFESLWQSRSGGDSRPHFGLGLYIVKLIAEFHGGRAAAESLSGTATGARFSVWLTQSTD